MTNPVATLSMFDPDSGYSVVEVFSGTDHTDPEFQAELTRSAVGDDYPNAVWAIGVNEAAREIMGNRRMRAMGFDV